MARDTTLTHTRACVGGWLYTRDNTLTHTHQDQVVEEVLQRRHLLHELLHTRRCALFLTNRGYTRGQLSQTKHKASTRTKKEKL